MNNTQFTFHPETNPTAIVTFVPHELRKRFVSEKEFVAHGKAEGWWNGYEDEESLLRKAWERINEQTVEADQDLLDMNPSLAADGVSVGDKITFSGHVSPEEGEKMYAAEMINQGIQPSEQSQEQSDTQPATEEAKDDTGNGRKKR